MANGDKWMIGLFTVAILYIAFCQWLLLTYF